MSDVQDKTFVVSRDFAASFFDLVYDFNIRDEIKRIEGTARVW